MGQPLINAMNVLMALFSGKLKMPSILTYARDRIRRYP